MNIYEPSYDETKIWRYMGFAKFFDLITTKQLFFSKTKYFRDPYEGYALPEIEARAIRDANALADHSFGRAGRAVVGPDGPDNYQAVQNLRNEMGTASRQGTLSALGSKFNSDRCFVSCWHGNPHESAAMWDLYLGGTEGVAIVSTVQKLYRNISRDVLGELAWGHVVYDLEISGYLYEQKVKLDRVFIPTRPKSPYSMQSIFTKRPDFRHEREFRIAFEDIENKYAARDFRAGLDLINLIDEIYISPGASRLIRSVINKSLEMCQLPIEPKISRLYTRLIPQ